MKKRKILRFVDLFAGIGGFRYGLEKCSIKNKRQSERSPSGNQKRQRGKQLNDDTKRFTCVYSNEWDKYASQIYKKHWGECDTRDIRTIKSGEIPDFDLLVGGFPCQAFSIAGKRRGFQDTRGTLFFEIARILKDKRPRYLLLENVKGLLSHENGKTFQTILGVLTDLGYVLQWEVLNSKNFGVPQNRERVFIIGHLRGKPRPKVFPIQGKHREVVQEKRSVGWKAWDDYNKKLQDLSPTLTEPHHNSIRLIRADEQDSQETGDKSDNTNAIRRTSYTNDMRIRRLTPTECERLQGFPDNFTKYGAGGELISDTRRYNVLGNAVSTPVITAIGKRLAQGLLF